MKKALALLIALILVFSCLSGTAAAEGYKSKLLNKTIKLPSKMTLVSEEKLADDSGVEFAFGIKGHPDTVIYTDAQFVEEFKGYTMKTLPDEVVDAWTEYYYEYYPENAVAGRLPSDDKKGDDLYCYCGQGKDGGSMIVYASLQDQIFVCSYCMSEDDGFDKITMQATLEALNAVNAALAKKEASNGGRGSKSAPVYSHKDYDVIFVFLLLEDEDEDDLDLYDDEDFDFDYDDWDDDLDDADDLDDLYDDDDLDDSDDWSDDSGEDYGEDYGDDGDYDDGSYEDYGDYDGGGYEDYGDYDDGGDW